MAFIAGSAKPSTGAAWAGVSGAASATQPSNMQRSTLRRLLDNFNCLDLLSGSVILLSTQRHAHKLRVDRPARLEVTLHQAHRIDGEVVPRCLLVRHGVEGLRNGAKLVRADGFAHAAHCH